MSLTLQQLPAHLKKQLAPIYHLQGDDVLLQNEARDQICHRARALGFIDKQLHVVMPDFDWSDLSVTLQQQGLFEDKTLIDLRHLTGKFDKKAVEVLMPFLSNPSGSKCVIITTGKLTKAQLSTKFYKALADAATTIKLWPIARHQLPAWVADRMKRFGLRASQDAIAFLCDATEGNLVATQQALWQLQLLHPNDTVTLAMIQAVVSRHTHYTIYDLAQAALSGQSQQCLTILDSLRLDGVEPVLIAWNMVRELRAVCRLRSQLDQGKSLSSVLSSVWKSQQAVYQKALRTHSTQQLLALLARGSAIDLIIKGQRQGDCWLAFRSWVLGVSGCPLPVELS